MSNPIASGPYFNFTPNGIQHDLHVQWKDAVPTNLGEFAMDVNDPGNSLDPYSTDTNVGAVHNVTIFGLDGGQTYHYRVAGLDASNAVVEENAPVGTPIPNLPMLNIPPNPTTTTVTLGNVTALPIGEIFFGPLKKPICWPFPQPIHPPPQPCPIACVGINQVATLKIRALNGATPVAHVPVNFNLVWGHGTLNPSAVPGATLQVQTDANGWAQVNFKTGNTYQIAVVTASSPFDAASVSNPKPFYIVAV